MFFAKFKPCSCGLQGQCNDWHKVERPTLYKTKRQCCTNWGGVWQDWLGSGSFVFFHWKTGHPTKHLVGLLGRSPSQRGALPNSAVSFHGFWKKKGRKNSKGKCDLRCISQFELWILNAKPYSSELWWSARVRHAGALIMKKGAPAFYTWSICRGG